MTNRLGDVVWNWTDGEFYRLVARNEDGTVWARRFERLIVLKPSWRSGYTSVDRTPRPAYEELRA